MPYTISNVNIGSSANDGTGDPIRTAFDKINKNIANVYAIAITGGGGGGGNGYATIAYVDSVAAVNLTNLNNALNSVYAVNLTNLNNAINTVYAVNLNNLNNALANIQIVNLSNLGNALANINLISIINLTNLIANISANTPSPVGLVNSIASPGTTNGQIVFNTTDNKLYAWNGTSWINASALTPNANTIASVQVVGTLPSTNNFNGRQVLLSNTLYVYNEGNWISPSAAYTPTANSLASVGIWTDPYNLPNTTLFDGRTVFWTVDSNLYINIGGAWNSYNSYITGSGTPIVGANSINSAAIQAGAITSAKLASGSVVAGTIAAGAVSATELAANAVTANKILANAVTAGKIAAGAVKTEQIEAGAINSDLLAVNAVVAGKIAAGAISATEIAAGSLTANVFAANSVTANAIATNAVTTDKIAANSIDANKLAANSVYAGAIEANAVTSAKIQANAVTAVKIAALSIYAGALQANVVEANNIAANAVTAVQLAANSVYARALQANVVEANNIAANAITAVQLAANSVYARALQANVVEANNIVANAVTTLQIATNAITAKHIGANVITASMIDSRGLAIRDSGGNILFGSGSLARTITITDSTGNTKTLDQLSTATGSNPITFLNGPGAGGSFSSFAAANSAGAVVNNVIKLTDGNSYIKLANSSYVVFVEKGAQGSNGTNGTNGSSGSRGNYSVAKSIAGTSWNNDTANLAITEIFGGSSPTNRVNRDEVTLYNSAAKFSETRYWNTSTGTWIQFTSYINGGLLVDGTVTATQLAVDSVTTNKIAAGQITDSKITASGLSGTVIVDGTLAVNKLTTGTVATTSGRTFSLGTGTQVVNTTTGGVMQAVGVFESNVNDSIGLAVVSRNISNNNGYGVASFGGLNSSAAIVGLRGRTNNIDGNWESTSILNSNGVVQLNSFYTALNTLRTTFHLGSQQYSAYGYYYPGTFSPNRGSKFFGACSANFAGEFVAWDSNRENQFWNTQTLLGGNNIAGGFYFKYPGVDQIKTYAEIGHSSFAGYFAYLDSTNTAINVVQLATTGAYAIYWDGTGAPAGVGPFTGSHDGLLDYNEEFTFGDIVIDIEVVSKKSISDVITKVGLSHLPRQKAVVGVICNDIDKSDHIPAALSDFTVNNNSESITVQINEVETTQVPSANNDSKITRSVKAEFVSAYNNNRLVIFNSLGEGQINVCGEGGDIEIGDYITTSSMRGKGMNQNDENLKNYTVAKAREAVTFSSPTEVKTIACTYHCG